MENYERLRSEGTRIVFFKTILTIKQVLLYINDDMEIFWNLRWNGKVVRGGMVTILKNKRKNKSFRWKAVFIRFLTNFALFFYQAKLIFSGVN